MTAAQPQSPQSAFSLEDLRQLAQKELPALPKQLLPPTTALLGDLAPLRQWLSDTQGKTQPTLRHPRIALFLSRYDIVPDLQRELAALPALFAKPAHPLSAMAAEINADLQVYELDLASPSGNPATGVPALDEAGALQAIAYGMMAVQPGVDAVVIALPNPAAPVAAETIAAALGRGEDPLAALLQYGGFDIAAALGAALAARLARAAVILDDSADIVADLLRALAPEAGLHVRAAKDAIPQDMTPAAGLRGTLALGLIKTLCKAA